MGRASILVLGARNNVKHFAFASENEETDPSRVSLEFFALLFFGANSILFFLLNLNSQVRSLQS
jgi:hypothetical protein